MLVITRNVPMYRFVLVKKTRIKSNKNTKNNYRKSNTNYDLPSINHKILYNLCLL